MKNLKIILFTIVIFLTIVALLMVYITREQKVYKERIMKDIYSSENYDGLKVILVNKFNSDIQETISDEDIKLLFDTIKNQNIKYEFYNVDNIMMGSSLNLMVYDSMGKAISISISQDSIVINGKRYVTENDLVELLSKFIEKHKKFYLCKK